jgi:glutathione S-transferase
MIKLYFSPGACSLADHIALLEVGAKFEAEAVDIRTKQTASGEDFRTINPKGYVPALVLDDCEVLTENIAVLDWISEQYPQLRRNGSLSRTRQLEMLAYISTEIHGAYKPLWHGGGEVAKQAARERIASLFAFVASRLQGDYLFGRDPSAADCYLFVMLRWAERFDIAAPKSLNDLRQRMERRPSVRAALEREEGAVPLAGSPSAIDLRVRENVEAHRFERLIRDDAIAAVYYRDEGGRLALIHTEVPFEFSGQGIATDLAHGAFGLLRESGRKAILKCEFMARFANAHPEYADVVDG